MTELKIPTSNLPILQRLLYLTVSVLHAWDHFPNYVVSNFSSMFTFLCYTVSSQLTLSIDSVTLSNRTDHETTGYLIRIRVKFL